MFSNNEGKNSEKLQVNLTEDILKKTCYWIIFKFLIDPYHKQQNSSRADLIGGFIDRWLNRIPETLIFDKLLEENGMENVHVINDTFLYTDSISKNAPDILGLYKEDENHNKIYYPFVKFDNGKWYIEEEINPPFLEMKTFRKSHSLVTIPENQFEKDHYYAIVESDINDIYLISLFDENFISENYYNEIFNNPQLYEEFVNYDNGKQLKFPKDYVSDNYDRDILTPNEFLKDELGRLGTYKLLGIYKGSTISKFSIIAGTRNKIKDEPLYLSKVEPYYDPIKKYFNESFHEWEYFTQIKCIPVFINPLNSKITIVNETLENALYVYIDGKAKINNKKRSNGYFKLEFESVIHDATKYYYLSNVKKCKKRPVFKNEKELPKTGLIYKHYGVDKSFSSINISLDENSYLDIIENNKKNNIFKVRGKVQFNGKDYFDGCYKVKFENEEGIYIFNSKKGSIEPYNRRINNPLNISFPDGNYKFKDNLPVFEPISIKIYENSSLNIIKMKKDLIQVTVKGKAEINKEFCLENNSYQLKFGYNTIDNVKHYILKRFNVINRSENIETIYENLDEIGDRHYLFNGLNYPVSSEKDNSDTKDYDILYIRDDNSIYFDHNFCDLKDIEKESIKNLLYEDIFDNSKIKIRNVPFNVKLVNNSSIEVIKKGKTTLICVNGEAFIDNKKIHNKDERINSGIYNLFFEKFDRSSDKEEIVFSKSIIPDNEICEAELIDKFKEIIKRN